MNIRIPLKKIKIPGGGLHLVCGISADDFYGNVIIDTGASVSVFHAETFAPYFTEIKQADNDALSSGINAMIEGHSLGKISGITIESLPLNDEFAGLMDLSHIKEVYQAYFDISIDGLIGSDLLEKYKAVIDFKQMILIFQNINL